MKSFSLSHTHAPKNKHPLWTCAVVFNSLEPAFFSFLRIHKHKQNKRTKKKKNKTHRPNEFLSLLLTNVCVVVNWERNAAHWGDLVLKHKTHTQKWISWFIHKSSSSGYCYLFFCPTPSVSCCFPNVRLYVRWNHPFKLCVCVCMCVSVLWKKRAVKAATSSHCWIKHPIKSKQSHNIKRQREDEGEEWSGVYVKEVKEPDGNKTARWRHVLTNWCV